MSYPRDKYDTTMPDFMKWAENVIEQAHVLDKKVRWPLPKALVSSIAFALKQSFDQGATYSTVRHGGHSNGNL